MKKITAVAIAGEQLVTAVRPSGTKLHHIPGISAAVVGVSL